MSVVRRDPGYGTTACPRSGRLRDRGCCKRLHRQAPLPEWLAVQEAGRSRRETRRKTAAGCSGRKQAPTGQCIDPPHPPPLLGKLAAGGTMAGHQARQSPETKTWFEVRLQYQKSKSNTRLR